MSTEQERAAFKAWWDGLPESMKSLLTHEVAKQAYELGRAALQSQDKEDAERYRWLRQQRTITDLACVTWNIGHDWVQMDGAELDAAIDHARRIEGEGE